MLVRHNTKLLEQAIELQVKRAAIPTLAAEAAAHDKIARANAFRRMMTGGAIAIAAVGIGLGAALFWGRVSRLPPIIAEIPAAPPPIVASREPEKGTDRLPSETIDQGGKTTRPKSPDVEDRGASEQPAETTPASPPAPESEPLGKTPEVPPASDPPTTDFTKFLTREVDWGGSHWSIVSGHHYSDEKDPTWDFAWCYTHHLVDGVDVNVDLVKRNSPLARPQAPIAPPTTLKSIGLTDASAIELASNCAWSDGSTFASTDYDIPTGREPAPTDDLAVQDGWDALGSDLPGMPIRNVDVDGCRNECQANDSCLAFTYNKKFRACFLKSAPSVLIQSADATTGAKASVAANLKHSDLVLSAHKALMGDMLSTGRAGYSECVLACATNDQCVGFNSNANTFCTLFARVTVETQDPNFASGRKASF